MFLKHRAWERESWGRVAVR